MQVALIQKLFKFFYLDHFYSSVYHFDPSPPLPTPPTPPPPNTPSFGLVTIQRYIFSLFKFNQEIENTKEEEEDYKKENNIQADSVTTDDRL